MVVFTAVTVTVSVLDPTTRASTASSGVSASSSLVIAAVALASFLVAVSVTESVELATDAV